MRAFPTGVGGNAVCAPGSPQVTVITRSSRFHLWRPLIQCLPVEGGDKEATMRSQVVWVETVYDKKGVAQP